MELEPIRVAEYHNRPITPPIEWPDGTSFVLRQPLEEDYFRLEELESEFNKRRRAYERKALAEAQKVVAKAKAEAEKAKKRIEKGSREDPDAAARLLIDQEGDKDKRPLDTQPRYLQAARISVFTEPVQTPEKLLQLGPHLLTKLELIVLSVVRGDAAKKELAAESKTETV